MTLQTNPLKSGQASQDQTFSQILARWNAGDKGAANELTVRVYDELHRIAHRLMQRERREHTLQTTAVLHEAYLELVDSPGIRFEDRSQFFGFAATLMRRVLVRHARRRGTQKRGGQVEHVLLEDDRQLGLGKPLDVLALDDALSALAENDPRKSAIVELRVFGGLTVAETARYLGLGTATVNRQWRQAITWLYRDLKGDSDDGQHLEEA